MNAVEFKELLEYGVAQHNLSLWT